MLGIVFTSLNLVARAISLFAGNVTAVVGIGVNIWLLVMLNRDDVQRWCGGDFARRVNRS